MSSDTSSEATQREPWQCVECVENPGDRGVVDYASHGDLCGWHFGVKKGYISR